MNVRQGITLMKAGAICLFAAAFFFSDELFPDREQGLLSKCWSSNQAYVCHRGEPLVWHNMPIQVTADSQHFLVIEVLDTWNEHLGFTAFEYVNGPERADCLVYMGVPRSATEHAGYTTFGRVSLTEMYAQVWVTELPYVSKYQVLYHEFGHVIGLKHDNYPESPMWFQIPGVFQEYRVSDSDRTLLRALYSH